MKYKVGNPCPKAPSPLLHISFNTRIKINLVSGKPKPSATLLLKRSRSLWTSLLAVESLICRWVCMNGPLLAKSEHPRGLFSAAQERFRAGKGAEQPSKSSLFSAEGMPKTRCPTVQQNQYPQIPWNTWGSTHLNVFIFTVDVVKRRRETFLRVPLFMCALLFLSCAWFYREAKETRAFLGFLVQLVTAARKVTGWGDKCHMF